MLISCSLGATIPSPSEESGESSNGNQEEAKGQDQPKAEPARAATPPKPKVCKRVASYQASLLNVVLYFLYMCMHGIYLVCVVRGCVRVCLCTSDRY